MHTDLREGGRPLIAPDEAARILLEPARVRLRIEGGLRCGVGTAVVRHGSEDQDLVGLERPIGEFLQRTPAGSLDQHR